jgi:hypothetical protein
MKQRFKVSKGHTNSFLPSWALKNVTWSGLSEVLSRRMAQRTQICPPNVLKFDFVGRWSDVWRYRRVFRIYFLRIGHRINRLGRICLSDVICRRIALRNRSVRTARLKKRLVKSMKRCFRVSKGHTMSFTASWASKNSTWMKSLKWWFKWANGPENS